MLLAARWLVVLRGVLAILFGLATLLWSALMPFVLRLLASDDLSYMMGQVLHPNGHRIVKG